MRLRREHTFNLALLLILATASWIILIWQTRTASGMAMALPMGASLFLVLWVIMMVAMMFPSVAPMVLAFIQIQHERRGTGRTFAPTWVFIGAYLLVWTIFGLLAYAGTLGVTTLAQRLPWLIQNTTRISGGIIVLCGLYQFTPLKHVCLTKCRTAQDFISSSWQEGYRGTLFLGMRHGLYCLGSYWLLFVLLLVLGMMNLPIMVLLTLLIFAEKLGPSNLHTEQFVALALILYGTLVIIVPAALPLSGAAM